MTIAASSARSGEGDEGLEVEAGGNSDLLAKSVAAVLLDEPRGGLPIRFRGGDDSVFEFNAQVLPNFVNFIAKPSIGARRPVIRFLVDSNRFARLLDADASPQDTDDSAAQFGGPFASRACGSLHRLEIVLTRNSVTPVKE